MIWSRNQKGVYLSGWFEIRRVTQGFEAWFRSRHELYIVARCPNLKDAKEACELRSKANEARWNARRDRQGIEEGGDYRLRDRGSMRSFDLLSANEEMENSGVQAVKEKK